MSTTGRATFFLIGVLVITFFSCHNNKDTIHPVVQDISESVYASGVVKSKNQYQVFSTVNGIVKEIFVDEGDTVRKGSSLIKIFNKTSVLNARNAELTAAYAKLSANKQKLDEAKMAIDLAESKMKNDSILWERQQKLSAQNIGTRVELEQRELSYKNSLKNYRSLRLEYNDLQRQLVLNEKQSRNNLDISTTVAEEYTIKSEIDGKVYSMQKEQGELVNGQSPIALIGDASRFYLELKVDEYDIARVREDQDVYINMDSYKGQVFKARITKINPAMDERSKSFMVEAEFMNQPPKLYPFLTAETNIVIQTKKNTLTIPRSYLLNDSTVLLKGNKQRKVKTGLKDYKKVEVTEGLTKEDYIQNPEK